MNATSIPWAPALACAVPASRTSCRNSTANASTLWSGAPEISTYARNALAPAVISRIVVDEAENLLKVTVPDDQLTSAIGRKGQNVKLAAKLLGWKIDIFH